MTAMRNITAILGAGAASAVLAASSPTGPRYGDTLLESVKAKGVTGLKIASRDKKGGAIVVVSGRDGTGTDVPLADAMGAPIGTLTVVAARGAHPDAAAVSRWLSRRIYVADNLAEPDPFVAGARRAPRAQALVEEMLGRFPDLVTLAFHVAPPGRPNIILASNFGRIGKLADKDDEQVIREGIARREVTNEGRRLAVELPVHDRAGRTIGALSTSFSVPAGNDPQAAYPRAVMVRDALAARIPSLEALTAD